MSDNTSAGRTPAPQAPDFPVPDDLFSPQHSADPPDDRASMAAASLLDPHHRDPSTEHAARLAAVIAGIAAKPATVDLYAALVDTPRGIEVLLKGGHRVLLPATARVLMAGVYAGSMLWAAHGTRGSLTRLYLRDHRREHLDAARAAPIADLPTIDRHNAGFAVTGLYLGTLLGPIAERIQRRPERDHDTLIEYFAHGAPMTRLHTVLTHLVVLDSQITDEVEAAHYAEVMAELVLSVHYQLNVRRAR